MASKKKPEPQAKKPRKPLTKLDKVTINEIVQCAEHVHSRISKLEKPELKFPERSLRNAKYDKKGGFQMGRGRVERTLTVNSVKTFAQSLRLMALSKEMVEQDDFATKREAYYVSKNWQEAKFTEQGESDSAMDDIEALFSLSGVTREQLRFRPEEHGGNVAGELIVIDRDRETGTEERIDCTKQGSGSYSIPSSVEHFLSHSAVPEA